jgi:hypothetical protein
VVIAQPYSALFTAAMISLIVMSPEPSASPLGHADGGVLPNAMFTMMMSSFTVTSPLPSQSPVQPPAGGVGVGVGCGAAPVQVPPVVPSTLLQSASSTHEKLSKSPPLQNLPVD